jgi:Lrp/AsnC family transcriptional regulator for asnA, asnC and gidA
MIIMNPKITVDDIDIKIIKALQKNSRASLTNLAKEMGVSKGSISLRLKRLKEIGIITGAILEVDLTKFGYECLACITVKACPKDLREIVEFVRKIEGTEFTGDGLGSFNAFCAVVFVKKLSELQNIKEQIKKHPSVQDIKVSVWINTEKALARPENICLEHLRKN